MAVVSLRTDRLLLRRWRDDDIEPFAAICADPEVMRYIGAGAVRSLVETKTAVQRFEEEWEQKGFGLFALERVEDKRLIGFTGLSEPTYLPEIMPAVEIGWRLERSAWGAGYATEAARSALAFGQQDRSLTEIVSIHQIGNEPSGRIMRKLGMTFDRETVDPTCGRVVRVFRARGSELSKPAINYIQA
jgi:RimJ/RimL family protein N-acetyltransferase